jgi:hypothetical protein
MKNLQKKLKNSCQLAAPKNLCRIFFCLTGKICLLEISLFIQITGFFSVFADGRVKPRYAYISLQREILYRGEDQHA